MAKDKKKDAGNPLKGGKGKADELSKKKGLDDPDAPGEGDRFDNEEHLGAALLIEVLEAVTGFKTENGDADVIRANVHVLTKTDGKKALAEPIAMKDTLIWGQVVFSSLKGKVGKYVVGVMGQGEKKPGKNAPWQIKPANEKQKALAQGVLDSL